ncbi:hypothetical protein BRD02_07160 [Halobacteriales archaeon QS_8_69_73]|nr:MAG: hypothetical protein BRD02_07160 [Halobacteriales archaeon QS_8_69_73]
MSNPSSNKCGLGEHDPHSRPRFEYESVDGGTLVYLVRREERDHLEEPVETDRRLRGFVDVDDWDAVRSELCRRGHDVGAVHHLPTFDRSA